MYFLFIIAISNNILSANFDSWNHEVVAHVGLFDGGAMTYNMLHWIVGDNKHALISEFTIINDMKNEDDKTLFQRTIPYEYWKYDVFAIDNSNYFLITKNINDNKYEILQNMGYRSSRLKYVSSLYELIKNMVIKSTNLLESEENEALLSKEEVFAIFESAPITRSFTFRGHSSRDSHTITGFSMDAFKKCMRQIHSLNPAFILIGTCYIGGENAYIFSNIEMYGEKSFPNYPIFLIGFGDNTIDDRSDYGDIVKNIYEAALSDISLSSINSALSEYLEDKLKVPSSCKVMLPNFYEDGPRFIHRKNIFVLEKTSKKNETAQKEKEIIVIAPVIYKFSLTVLHQSPLFHSAVGGESRHVIQQLNLLNTSITRLREIVKSQVGLKQKRSTAWFFGRIRFYDGFIRNCCLFLEGADQVSMLCEKQCINKCYMYINFGSSYNESTLDVSEYQNLIRQILAKTNPSEFATENSLAVKELASITEEAIDFK